jgi:hypothetical protein
MTIVWRLVVHPAVWASGSRTRDRARIRSLWEGRSRTRSHSVVLRAAGFSQIRLETATRPRACSSATRRRSAVASGSKPERVPGPLRQGSYLAGVPEHERRLSARPPEGQTSEPDQ